MAWVRLELDGGDLVMARFTRRHPAVVAFALLGLAGGLRHPCAIRVQGLTAFQAWRLKAAFRARLWSRMRMRRKGSDWRIDADLPSAYLATGPLEFIVHLGHNFEAAYVRHAEGRVLAFLPTRSGVDAAAVVARAPGIQAALVPRPDLTPWQGLELPAPPVVEAAPRSR